MEDEEKDIERAKERLIKYITETPDDKYPELSVLPKRLVFPFARMDMYAKLIPELSGQLEQNREWWYKDKRVRVNRKYDVFIKFIKGEWDGVWPSELTNLVYDVGRKHNKPTPQEADQIQAERLKILEEARKEELNKFTYQKEKVDKSANMFTAMRTSFYKHSRSIEGANLKRITAVGETELMGKEDEDELDEHEGA